MQPRNFAKEIFESESMLTKGNTKSKWRLRKRGLIECMPRVKSAEHISIRSIVVS